MPLPGIEVRIAGKDDQPLAPGTVGEIQVRGPNVFAGYWRAGAFGEGRDRLCVLTKLRFHRKIIPQDEKSARLVGDCKKCSFRFDIIHARILTVCQIKSELLQSSG